jgi:hypothetical protein
MISPDKKSNNEENQSLEDVTWKKTFLFVLILTASTLVNFDHGIIPAATSEIK